MDVSSLDGLLDFSNEDIFSTSSSISTAATTSSSCSFPPPHHNHLPSSTDNSSLYDICSDDAAHLEWLSQFVDDSFADFPADPLGGILTSIETETSFHGKPRSKRSWTPMLEYDQPKKEHHGGGGMRRCIYCASEKTPQWRTGPLGPKTLCNACGVRFKSGRLVPEYRPASSPTFVLTQHSNSHRKVMELPRQKEVMRRPHQVQLHHHHHPPF